MTNSGYYSRLFRSEAMAHSLAMEEDQGVVSIGGGRGAQLVCLALLALAAVLVLLGALAYQSECGLKTPPAPFQVKLSRALGNLRRGLL